MCFPVLPYISAVFIAEVGCLIVLTPAAVGSLPAHPRFSPSLPAAIVGTVIALPWFAPSLSCPVPHELLGLGPVTCGDGANGPRSGPGLSCGYRYQAAG